MERMRNTEREGTEHRSIQSIIYRNIRLKKTRAVVVHGEQLKKMTPTTLTEILANYEDVNMNVKSTVASN